MLAESVRMALEGLSRNALRSALTGLGVLIGCGAVIAMIAIGQGASINVRDEIAKLGAEVLVLTVGQHVRGGNGIATTSKPFDYSDVEAIRSQVRGLRHVAPLSQSDGRAAARNANWNVRIFGTENDFFQARGWGVVAGRLFTEGETYNGKPVCIISEAVRQRLYPNLDGPGETLRIAGIACTVVGVLEQTGKAGSAHEESIVAVPFDMFQRRIQGDSDIQSVVMAAYPEANMDRVKMLIAGLMRERRDLAANDKDDFALLDMRQVAQSMSAAARTFTLFLGAIAAVSLVVGGIGIMNIMLVSVSERTREIGVRLAIGALPSQIRQQFLIEAVLLTLSGGVMGIATGLGIAAMAAPYLSIPLVIDPVVIAGTVAVTTALGVFFGYVPASRAAALDPIVALRHV